MKRSDIEIMAPVGSYESLHAAIEAGADSVYFGVEGLNMRAASSVNFTLSDLAKIVKTAHEAGVRTYLTVNTIVYDTEILKLHAVIDRAKREGVDALIVADQATIDYARSVGMEVHISTQLNISNTETLRFYSQWADVAVLARELSLEQVEYIHSQIESRRICGPSGNLMRIEMFAHGALCMAISGKCYLSVHETGCSANRGACRQICRRSYILRDKETGAEIATEGQYLLSPKDLCTIGFLDKMIAAGVRVLKIEGRARGADYVKRVTECYDAAVRAICDGKYNKTFADGLITRLRTVFNRDFWGGYYLGKPVPELSGAYGSSATKRKVFVGKVTNFYKKIGVAEIYVEASPLERGSEVMIFGETTGIVEMRAREVYVAERPTEVAPQGEYCSVKTPKPVHRGDKLYKLVDGPARK